MSNPQETTSHKNQLKPVTGKERGHPHRMGPLPINIVRLLPMQVKAVGAFVFLDHFKQESPVPAALLEAGPNGAFAHPHRGIVTLTYLLEGDVQHFDSCGHSGTVGKYGVQWMKSGSGIVHDEWVNLDTGGGKNLDGLQFWINLQPQGKAEAPEYKAVQAEQLPVINLPGNAGSLRVIVGEYKEQCSPIPRDSDHFLYHLKLSAGACTSLALKTGHEVAVLVASGAAKINGQGASGELVHFDNDTEGKLKIQNSDSPTDILIFGGEPYTAPIVSGAQYVMNTEAELRTAFADHAAGAYGQVDYSGFKPFKTKGT